MSESVDHSGVVLANLPAGRAELRIALVVGLVMLGIGVVAVPFGTARLPESDAWAPIAFSFIFVADLITWFLLISQFDVVRTPALLVLASGYLFAATMDIPVLLTFPGVFSAQKKELIEAALSESGGRVSGPAGAAAILGIHRSTLESKITSLNINKHRFKDISPSKGS